jgi:hypothetical protein
VSGFASGRAVVVECFDDLEIGQYELALMCEVAGIVADASYLLGRLDGDGVLLWDGDLHWFGGVVLVTLEGSPELFVWVTVSVRRRPSDPGRSHYYGRDTP